MSDEFKVQWSVSLPPSAQYAKGDMLNLRGETVDEVEAIFDEVLAGEFIGKASQVAGILRAAQTVTETPAGGSNSQSAAPASSGDSGGGVSNLRVCEHGKRTRREGTSAKGKWVGHFCPEKNKSQQCAVQWEDN